MADFASLAAKMDAQVDDRLGDSIFYKRPEDADFVELKAFLIFDEPAEGGWQPRDTIQGTIRLKIRRGLRPLSQKDRIHAPKLPDGIYRPMGKNPTTAGRYDLVDLQKVA